MKRTRKTTTARDIIALCRKLGQSSRTMKALEADLPGMSEEARVQLLNVLKDVDATITRYARRHRGIPGPPDRKEQT